MQRTTTGVFANRPQVRKLRPVSHDPSNPMMSSKYFTDLHRTSHNFEEKLFNQQEPAKASFWAQWKESSNPARLVLAACRVYLL